MNARWTEADLRRINATLQAQIMAPTEGPRSKYRNVKTEFNGQKFDSRKELADYRSFKAQELMGAIRSVIRQVSLPLPGAQHRIRIDFVVVENGGRIRWFDSKGFETAAWRSKREQVKSAYGLTIELI